MDSRRSSHGDASRAHGGVGRSEPDLMKRGFKFVGSTICYAFMQAVGLVNDHTTACFRHALVRRKSQ